MRNDGRERRMEGEEIRRNEGEKRKGKEGRHSSRDPERERERERAIHQNKETESNNVIDVVFVELSHESRIKKYQEFLLNPFEMSLTSRENHNNIHCDL